MKLNVSVDGVTFGTLINQVEVPPELRVKRPSGHEAWDRAVGGKGLTPSMITLFTGEPGAGKTTLMLTVASYYAARGCTVVYNTAEESAFQVRMTYDRLRLAAPFAIGQVENVSELLTQCDLLRKANPDKPFILIQDSLQTLDDGYFKNGRITSATAERACQSLTDWTKRRLEGVSDDVAYPNTIIIGQVNKSGGMAGTNKLKHMVDAMCHLSVDRNENSDWFDCRKLFTEKNRFGGAGMLSFMRMGERGLSLVGIADTL